MWQHITKPAPGREFLMANKHHPTNRNCMVHSSRFGSVSGPTALTMEAQERTIACLLVDGIRQRLPAHLSPAKLDGSSQEFRTLSGPAGQKGIDHAPSPEISVSRPSPGCSATSRAVMRIWLTTAEAARGLCCEMYSWISAMSARARGAYRNLTGHTSSKVQPSRHR